MYHDLGNIIASQKIIPSQKLMIPKYDTVSFTGIEKVVYPTLLSVLRGQELVY